VVEDDEASRYAVAKSLETAGYRVLSFADHNGALDAIDAGGPADVLVTDIVMPGHANGFALARMAKLRRPTLNVLYITAYYQDLPVAELQAALGPILPKPFSPEGLVSAVEASLAGVRGVVLRPPKHDDMRPEEAC
jgi:CheY-like chemotaxis protein